jgi:probable 2-oxoglutarate dehydrogenase E1 component DHKTD1
MYEQISARRSVPQLYEQKLMVYFCALPLVYHYLIPAEKLENTMNEQEISAARNDYKAHLEGELGGVSSYVPKTDILQAQWSGIVWPASEKAESNPVTGVDTDTLVRIGKVTVAVPDGFVGETMVHVQSRTQFSAALYRRSIRSSTGTSRTACRVLRMDVVLTGQLPRWV